jgi:polyribonucleotide nucleotidyltransferase
MGAGTAMTVLNDANLSVLLLGALGTLLGMFYNHVKGQLTAAAGAHQKALSDAMIAAKEERMRIDADGRIAHDKNKEAIGKVADRVTALERAHSEIPLSIAQLGSTLTAQLNELKLQVMSNHPTKGELQSAIEAKNAHLATIEHSLTEAVSTLTVNTRALQEIRAAYGSSETSSRPVVKKQRT